MARAHSGCEVLEQSFLALDLPDEHFDGVFANAVLFHVPQQELPRVLAELRETLKPSGVLFSSNPRGDGREGWSGERYGCFHDWPSWRAVIGAARIHRTRPLLPACGRSVRAATLAGQRLAQATGLI